jgi:hypothetical protein
MVEFLFLGRDVSSEMRSIRYWLVMFPVGAVLSFDLQAAIPSYHTPTIYARTGVTSFNLPGGSSLASPTVSMDDNRDVGLDVNFVGNTGNPGLFYGQYDNGSPSGGIVADASDTISGDPYLNGVGQAVFTVGLDGDPFLYDRKSDTTTPLNYPLGVTDSSNLALTATQHLGGRLEFGFTGDIYGTFPAQSAGFPALTVYAADSGVDVSSPYSFLYTPDTSQNGGVSGAPRIAAKVSTTAGFDFEEIHVFDANGSSNVIAVETEIDPMSPFSEFITNSVSISDDGTKVAFQAVDTMGVSGIYRYDDLSGAIDIIASEVDPFVNAIDIFAPDVNNQGLVVFRGDDANGRSSVFVGDGNELVRLAGEGDWLATDIGERQLGRRDMDFSQSGAPRINNRGDIGFIFQYFDPTNMASIADGSLLLVATTGISGDFDGNGLYECVDIDALVAEIASGNHRPEFDLTADGLVDLQDRDAWLAEAGTAQLASGNPYLLGDTNLDGFVDGIDFIQWNAHRFTSTAAWCNGDFNADGFVDGSDFIVWNDHKFTSADVVIVPEPGLGACLAMVLLWQCAFPSRRGCGFQPQHAR